LLSGDGYADFSKIFQKVFSLLMQEIVMTAVPMEKSNRGAKPVRLMSG